ncbi:MAG: hypothetical protein ALECFALPRED_005545 [Alectoria fallacina]|uniref:Carrier domain-containing protein n=1 Tax=Alectoria fallacina TaxID=1903189 RepID=A0A8H3IMC0_9LECA|nr:MAG: hypothetical protein ALECFALPRED_005545 [Alectoria fallacina]
MAIQNAAVGDETKDISISLAELEQIQKWNETVPPTIEACVHHLVEERVRDQPDDTAVCSRDGSLTYQELDTYAARCARRLIQYGIKPDDLVPICFEKSKWNVVAMLATLKAGAAFVPIPCSPVQRIKTILTLVKSTVILTSSQQASVFTDMSEHVIVVEKNSCDKVDTAKAKPLVVDVRPSNLAYVLFTSGSTGIPKGAQIEHSQLCTHLKTWGDTVGLDRTSKVFQFSAHVFDAVIDEVFLPLIYGGTICIPSDDDRMNNIASTMRDMRVTYALFTPSLLSTLRPEDFDLATLKTLVIAGESPPQDLLTLWASTSELQVLNAYGPTECCVICCAANITQSGPRARNMGRAIGDTLWIVDASDISKLASIGAVGELLIEGPTVGRGYIGADERTATAFVSAPSWLRDFRSGSTHRLYRTGDLVKYNDDGTIEFVDRKDNQVKLRGQRMELGEVEHQIRRALPSRTGAIADIISSQNHGGEPMLVAFVRLGGETDMSKSNSSSIHTVTDSAIKQRFNNLVADLKTQLSDVLPPYMIPSAFIAMASLPHLDSSKVDRAKLREIAIDSLYLPPNGVIAGGTSESQRPPLTDTEKQLQQIWAEAFRIAPSRISLDDHFFRLGGDSVTAIRLVAIARRAGFFLTVHMLFDHPTISQLAAAVQLTIRTIQEREIPQPYSLLGDKGSAQDLRIEAISQCGIRPDIIKDIYPLPKHYEIYMAAPELRAAITFPLPAQIDLERYIECWKRLITSHDMLRTRIIKTTTGLYSIVTTEPPVIRTATEVEKFIAEEKKITIGFGSALSQYCLIKDPNDVHKTCFVWTAHHVIYDDWSLGLLNAKLRSAYTDSNLALTEEPKPKELVQYFQSLDHNAILEHWRAHYAGVTFKPLFSLPARRYWDADQEIPLRINLSPSTTTKKTPFTVAWALALSEHFETADIALGILRSGRTFPVSGIENFIGPLVNAPPWHIHIDSTALVHDLVRDFQRDLWESTAYEAFGMLEAMTLSPESAAASTDLVWLNIHAKDIEAEEAEKRGENELPAPEEEMFYPMAQPLRLECAVDKTGLSATAHFDSSLRAELVRGLMQTFEQAFEALSSAGAERRILDVMSGDHVGS